MQLTYALTMGQETENRDDYNKAQGGQELAKYPKGSKAGFEFKATPG